MANKKPKDFGDLAQPGIEADEFHALDDLLDTDIRVYMYVDRKGDKGAYLQIQFAMTDDLDIKLGLNTSAVAIVDKIVRAQAEGLLPLDGCIIKVEGKDYYDIVAPKK